MSGDHPHPHTGATEAFKVESFNVNRNTTRPVILVGFLEGENLGLGYLAAMLRSHGYKVIILDFERDPEDVLNVVRTNEPMIIGFSLIFQFYIEKFASLLRYLRNNGVNAHFTIGGHFASLSSEQTLRLIPELDTVVRFEGEQTLLELADQVSTGGDYRNILGIAYVKDGKAVCTPMRPLVHDLDNPALSGTHL